MVNSGGATGGRAGGWDQDKGKHSDRSLTCTCAGQDWKHAQRMNDKQCFTVAKLRNDDLLIITTSSRCSLLLCLHR